MGRRASLILARLALAALVWTPTAAAGGGGGLDPDRLAALRSVDVARISPGGSHVAYTLTVPRRPGVDEDGAAWSELHLVPADEGPGRAWVAGEVNASHPRFSPDGRRIFYLAKREDDEHAALWAIAVDGGESRRVLAFDTAIRDYRLHPDGGRVAFVADEAEPEQREKAKEKGYKQEIFEEDWRPRRAWIAALPDPDPPPRDPSAPQSDGDDEEKPRPLELDGAVFQLEWSPDGSRLAVALAPRPLVDDRYMRRRIHIVDARSEEILARLDNPGKLGSFGFSPDGQHIAAISAADPNDPRDGRLLVAPVSGGELRDVLPSLEGHVSSFGWRDARTLMYVADQGTRTELGQVGIERGARRKVLVAAEAPGPILSGLTLSRSGQRAALLGQRSTHPDEVWVMKPGNPGDGGPRRRTDSNPWLSTVTLAEQEVVRWRARDGLELEGILLRPLDDRLGSPAPLLLMVHGGPEGHDQDGWVTSYSRPGQTAAARGYAVLYPNYRGSTGRGVAFSKLGQGDAAGKEFDDLVDAVDHLVAADIADTERVGILGGSYGGYATAWCATRHTDRFRAGVMFVGISNKISKGLTTEIPTEDEMVHTRFEAWKNWDFSLERSPIYHAGQSRTALLIAGGTADTRVHPSQSLQLYRALKLIGEAPVRYVRYPGEGHGNRKSAARDDYSRRLLRWMDHFLLTESKELPPWDLGLGQEEEEEEEEEERDAP